VPLSANPLLVGAAFVGLWLVLVVLLRPRAGAAGKALPPISTRGVRPRGPVYIPLELGKVTIDLQPTATETVHVVIGGSTRTGKSTSVLPLFDLDIGVLCIALDISVPIEAKIRALGGIVWTNDPDECRIGLDILSGPARIASEGLVAGFPKAAGNIGDYQRSAREVIWSGMDRMDAEGIDRSLPDIILALLRPMSDSEAARACRSWARKLANLYRIIGPTLGTDLDVVRAMRDRQKVLLKLNHFLSPDDSPFLAGMLLVLARRVMEQAGVPFVLIVEEAGQAAIAQGHLAPIAQAGAARGAPTVILTQNMSTLPLEVRNNLAVTVSFAQEDATEQRAAAARLELVPEQLRRSAFPDKGVGWCYVRAPGLPTTLAHVKQQRPLKPAPSPLLVGPSSGPSVRTVDGVWDVVERGQLDGWQPWPLTLPDGTPNYSEDIPEAPPAWVGTDRDMLRMWAQCVRTGRPCPLWSPERGLWWDERGCLEWSGGKSKAGRPRSSVGSRDVLVYREFYLRAKGVAPDPSFDHWCDNPACVDPEHGEPCSIPDNNARRAPRKAAFMVAWAERRRRERRVPAGSAAD
jgi:hypothetical protein